MKFINFLYFFCGIFLLSKSEIEDIALKERLERIAYFINEKGTTWKAAVPSRDYSILLGSIVSPKNSEEIELQSPIRTSKGKLPEQYDAREGHPECADIIGEIPDQANCGSCWAVASASVMSDRICIKSEGKIKKLISSVDLTSCCKDCGHGCSGGNDFASFVYWQKHGIVTGGKYGDINSCKPYFLPECDHHMKVEILGPCPERTVAPECERKCINEYDTDYEEDKSYGKSIYSVWNDEKEIMREIYENGPVVAHYNVYEDFLVYESGVYQHFYGDYKGGHAVRILGWGVEDGIKYWIVSNSWNKNWGIGGTFRIIRGKNECNIEENIYAGLPK